MKYLFLSFLLVFSTAAAFSQAPAKPKFVIDQYWLVILKTGPKDKEITDSVQRATIFAGHFANMTRLHKEGVLKAAGPFGKNDLTWRGLFILDCKTKEEAQAFVDSDPSVKAGVFISDIVPWYSEPKGSFVHGIPSME